MIIKLLLLYFTSAMLSLSVSQPLFRFAAIGDYGRWYTGGEALVSDMIHRWNPDFIITLGDNNYEHGADSTIDSNIGQYYHDFIYPYSGIFGNGSPYNRFFPSLGNHDWLTNSALPYLNYFQLPGNERYYDFIRANCHFFVINSDINEPDGITPNSQQYYWLQNKMLTSVSRFKIVYFHHPPYSSGQHGNNYNMRWKFKQWGATAVLCGHEHNYERLVDSTGLTYFINGLGGKDWRQFSTIVPESRFRFTGNYGAMLVTVYNDSINFRFYAVPDSLKDDTTIIYHPIGIINESETVNIFSLRQNFPNPFNPETLIRFNIPEKEFVNLTVYDSKGAVVQVLLNENVNAGPHEVKFNASALSSGVYFYRLASGNFFDSKRMIILK